MAARFTGIPGSRPPFLSPEGRLVGSCPHGWPSSPLGSPRRLKAEPNRREFNGKAANARPAASALDVSYDVDDLGHPSVTAVVLPGRGLQGAYRQRPRQGVEHHLHLDVSFGEVR